MKDKLNNWVMQKDADQICNKTIDTRGWMVHKLPVGKKLVTYYYKRWWSSIHYFQQLMNLTVMYTAPHTRIPEFDEIPYSQCRLWQCRWLGAGLWISLSRVQIPVVTDVCVRLYTCLAFYRLTTCTVVSQ